MLTNTVSKLYTYSRTHLFNIRNKLNNRSRNVDFTTANTLKGLSLWRARGSRSGKKLLDSVHYIPILASGNQRCNDANTYISRSSSEKSPKHSKNSNSNYIQVPRIPNCVLHNRSIRYPCILMTNARSISNKLNELESLLHTECCDVAIITETWLSDSSAANYNLNGYAHFSACRNETRGGGVSCFVHDRFEAEPVATYLDDDCELLHIRVFCKASPHSIDIVGVYRPPQGSSVNCASIITTSLESTVPKTSDLILAGDFNRLDLSCFEHEFGLSALVNFPTRQNICLDQFLTNISMRFLPPIKMPPLSSSDHCVVLVKPKTRISNNVLKTVTVYDRRAPFVDKFSIAVHEISVNVLADRLECPVKSVESFDAFCSSMKKAFSDHIPSRQIRIKNRDPIWLTPTIKDIQNRRNKAFKSGNSCLFVQLTQNLSSAIKSSKANLLKKHMRGSKPFWNFVNERKGRTSSLNSLMLSFDSLDHAANVFNKQLVERFPTLVTPSEVPSFDSESFSDFSDQEVANAVFSLRTQSAPGPDGLPPWLLKACSIHVCTPLAILMSNCVRNGVCPSSIKEQFVVLLPKTRKPRALNDLRPIALTNAVGKVFERCVLNRVESHTSLILGNEQHAYRQKHSTVTALTSMSHNWLAFLDEQDSHYVRNIFVDFSKAFDSIEPALLSAKLLSYAYPEWFVCFVYNFLRLRVQFVRVDSVLSDSCLISRGLPQGTLLGPSLFSIMINDLKPIDVANVKVIRYADDQTFSIFVKKNMDDVSQLELNNISSWCVDNGLFLNAAKSKEMIICFSKRPCDPLPLSVDSSVIERVETWKCLGVTFSRDLSWSAHIDSIIKKAQSLIYLLRLIVTSNDLQGANLKFLIKSLLVPVLCYASPCWANISKQDLARLSAIHRRAFRILPGCVPNMSLEEILLNLQMNFFQDCLSQEHPLHSLIPCRTERASRNRKSLIPVPRTNTERLRRHFLASSIVYYNLHLK